MPVSDPTAPPEASEGGSRLRAKNLKNTPIILRPVELKTAMGKDRDNNAKEYEYMNCDVWVLDRQGVIETDQNLRITWWRALEQLKSARTGSLIACRPVEQDDNSVILASLEGAAKATAEQVAVDIEGGAEYEDPETEVF